MRVCAMSKIYLEQSTITELISHSIIPRPRPSADHPARRVADLGSYGAYRLSSSRRDGGAVERCSTTNMAYGQTCHRGNWAIYHNETGTRFLNNHVRSS